MITKNTPFFSIVTISYNQAIFLKDCIESVLNQTFRDFEYIIQDPGSSDASREIIKSFKSKKLKFFFEDDHSPADGLNKGFAKASGKFYLFLNSDDLLLKNALEEFYIFINKYPYYDVFSGATEIIDENSKKIRISYSDKFNLNRAAYGHCNLMQQSTTFRSSLFHSVGGFNKFNKAHWDGELFIDFGLKRAKFFKTDRILSKYRVTNDSITGSGKFEYLNETFFKSMYKKIKGKNSGRGYIFVSFFYQYLRKFLNLKDTFQRLLYGPVFKRKSAK